MKKVALLSLLYLGLALPILWLGGSYVEFPPQPTGTPSPKTAEVLDSQAVYIQDGDTQQIGQILRSLAAQEGIAYMAAPTSNLSFQAITGGHRSWKYGQSLQIDLVKIYYLWSDGQVHSAWLASGARLPDGQYISFVAGEDGQTLLNPNGLWPAVLISAQISGPFVRPEGIDWEACEAGSLPAILCEVGLRLEREFPSGIVQPFLKNGFVAQHPMYGFLIGWTIKPIQIVNVSDYSGGEG